MSIKITEESGLEAVLEGICLKLCHLVIGRLSVIGLEEVPEVRRKGADPHAEKTGVWAEVLLKAFLLVVLELLFPGKALRERVDLIDILQVIHVFALLVLPPL